MIPTLTEVEARALGALIEKEITTPDYYPLSLNALLNACNQKSNREPVMELDEDTLRQALHGLDDKGLAGAARGSDSRVAKYEHQFSEVFNLGRREVAVICVLLLRGPQTVGEIRGRTERLYSFDELTDVQSTLERLAERETPMVRALARQPGTKESRYMHLFCGDVQPALTTSSRLEPNAAAANNPAQEERIQALEESVAQLRRDLDEMRDRLESLTR
jgi:uncharacterized protein